jgi:hypothetical protein
MDKNELPPFSISKKIGSNVGGEHVDQDVPHAAKQLSSSIAGQPWFQCTA